MEAALRRGLAAWRAGCLALVLGCSAAASGRAAGQPISNQELSLMLRGGYTNAEVLQEMGERHVVETLDPAAEKTLREAGADQTLLDALKSGKYTLAPTAAAEAKRRQETAEAQVAADREAGKDRLLNHAREEAEAAISRRMANMLRGKLVVCRNGKLEPYDNNVLATKKVIAFYFAAAWAPPCHAFTPWLLQFYQEFAPTHAPFEVVLVSADRSEDEMLKFMQAEEMPWPALAFGRKTQEPELAAAAKRGIPSLVLVDGAGGIIADSYDGAKYLGPRHVIAEIAKMAGIKITAETQVPDPVDPNSPPPLRKGTTLAGGMPP